MHGEMMKVAEGLTDSTAFIDKYLPPQLTRFTAEGLYRDPNLPVAYDLAGRKQLSGLLDAGYDGPHAEFLHKMLHRGALTMLFMQSTTGTTSCGGRSNQWIWNELTFALLCEKKLYIIKEWEFRSWRDALKGQLVWLCNRFRNG
ncbi:MAG: hypothetical protein J7639_07455 [Paenibacillaceae bacterium]|nr:hypothetical protein [Paenibacillaceae bacterium]